MEEHLQQRITDLFKSKFNEKIEKLESILEAGSSRQYYRIYSSLPQTLIACWGTNIEENNTFLYFSSILKKAKINVPEVFAVAPEKDLYIMSDVGTTDVLKTKENLNESETENLYKQILQDLIRIQIEGGKNIDFSHCFSHPEFDRTVMLWDLYYFKYYYLKISGLEFNEQKLENDFNTLLDFLETSERSFFMYRDFQARNILVSDGKLGYIDFQGAMKGPLQYDVVSLLFQAKANIKPDMRERLLAFYIENVSKEIAIDKTKFMEQFQGFVFIRILQTLGAYGFRGLIQHKVHFIQSIPQALTNLKQQTNIINEIIPLPYLSSIIMQLPELTTKNI